MTASLLLILIVVPLAQCAIGAPGNEPPGRVLDPYAPALSPNSNVTSLFAPHMRCPNGTYLVASSAHGWRESVLGLAQAYVPAERVNLNRYKFHGCCQEDSFGCFDRLNNDLVGCCPNGTVCCSGGNGFVGCAHTINQCCETSICPDGYGCCSESTELSSDTIPGEKSCCPIPPGGDVNDKSTYCNEVTLAATVTTNASTHYLGCLRSYFSTLDFCEYNTYTELYTGDPMLDWFENVSVAFTPDVCTTDASFWEPDLCFNYTARCPDVMTDCAYKTTSRIHTYEETLDHGILVWDEAAGCCPSGTTPCVDTSEPSIISTRNKQQDPVACADPALEETCCGPYICPAGTKCCSRERSREVKILTERQIMANMTSPLNYTRYYGCCPTELECCFSDVDIPTSVAPYPVTPLSPAQFNRRSFWYPPFYCGAPFRNESCMRNLNKNPRLFPLYYKAVMDVSISHSETP